MEDSYKTQYIANEVLTAWVSLIIVATKYVCLQHYLIPSVLAAFLLATRRCVQSRTPPADVSLGGGFEIDVSAAAIMKRFEQISDEDLNKK